MRGDTESQLWLSVEQEEVLTVRDGTLYCELYCTVRVGTLSDEILLSILPPNF